MDDEKGVTPKSSKGEMASSPAGWELMSPN